MIPLNASVTIQKAEADSWGIVGEGVAETYEVYLDYKIGTKGNETNTKTTTGESVVSGNVFFTGFNSIKQIEPISFMDLTDVKRTVLPDSITYIKDSSGVVLFTKVGF